VHDAEPFRFGALDERASRRRDEERVVASPAQRASKLQRDDLPAGELAADHEVRDPHA
jgi:hypothetical protein